MGRKYPSRPIVGVGAFTFRSNGDEVLIVRRGLPPSKGIWSVPGGAVEVGENLEEALHREIKEETALEIEILEYAATLDRIYRDDHGRVKYHYVLIDYLCEPTGGSLIARSDIAEACWARVAELEGYEMTEWTLDYLQRAAIRFRELKTGTASPIQNC